MNIIISILLLLAFILAAIALEKDHDLKQLKKDNAALIAMFKDQEKQRNNLISMGWSKDRADTFIENGCLNYIRVEWK
jgi:hypothetical protein